MIVMLLLIFCVNSAFTVTREELRDMQFQGIQISPILQQKVPFLTADKEDREIMAQLSTNNMFSVCFVPNERGYRYFTEVAGISIDNATFVASWYVFTNQNQIPQSVDRMIALVNEQKPYEYYYVKSMNSRWQSKAQLPYTAGTKNSYIYVFLSFPNADGVLVPIASRSFYKDFYNNDLQQSGQMSLNYELLALWDQKGYL